MISLFIKLISSRPVLRKMRNDSPSSSSSNSNGKEIWIQIHDIVEDSDSEVEMRDERILLWEHLQDVNNRQLLRNRLSNVPHDTFYMRLDRVAIQFKLRPWKQIPAYREDPREFARIRSSGFKNIPPVTPRIKAFRLRDAIAFSLKKDIRFSIALLAILGFSIWWGIAPEPLLLKPEALLSPDIHTLFTVAKDTFINKVCSTHPLISSPCECGEPLNNEAKMLLDTFDPLGIEKPQARRAKALAVYIAAILITLALAESVSIHGVYLNLND